MIKEAYVSFWLAQKLKDKGFGGGCRSYFRFKQDFNEWRKCAVTITTKDIEDDELLRPTLQMAMAWLREEHFLHVYAEYKCFCGSKKNDKPYYHWVPFIKPLPYCKYQIEQTLENYGLDEYCDTYEEACEKAIEYALDNLLYKYGANRIRQENALLCRY